jgi:probable F420-dependent oxidoreductase
MRFGIHLPVMAFDDAPFTLERFVAVAQAAERSGFDALAANDHHVFRLPWLDSPTALSAVISAAPTVTLMTTIALPVVRGPVALAKSLAAIDLLSGGRVVAGLGPGSTAGDYEAVGIPFEERWVRFDEAVRAMRALWADGDAAFVGRFYDTTGVSLAPAPTRQGGPPILIGSWGSDAGLRRVARLADGWLASGYNTTPKRFGTALRDLGDHLTEAGRDPEGFPNTVATMWLHLTDDTTERQEVLGRLAALLRREPEILAATLPIGTPDHCRSIVAAYRAAGAQRILFWPLTDEVRQIERLASEVLPGF